MQVRLMCSLVWRDVVGTRLHIHAYMVGPRSWRNAVLFAGTGFIDTVALSAHVLVFSQ